MTTDEWLILLMGMALACAPLLLIWTEERTRSRGIDVPRLFTIKGYGLTPHTVFGIVVAVALLSISYQMRGRGPSFVFLIFGMVGLIALARHVQKTKAR